MLKQNYAMEFLAKSANAQQVPFDFKKADNSEKMGFPQFKDILNGTLNRTQGKAQGSESVLGYGNKQRNEKMDKSTEVNTNQKPQFRSYREVKEAKDVATKKVEDKTSETSEVNPKEEIKSKDAIKARTKENVVMETLSQVLGISNEDLIKLLNAAGVNPQELTNETEAGDAIDKLASVLNLNDTQKVALSEILCSLRDMIKQYPTAGQEAEIGIPDVKVAKANKQDNPVNESNSKDGWVKVNNVDITVVDNRKLAEEFKEIMAQMKLKLDALAEKLQNNPLKFREDMLDSLKASLIQLTQGQISSTDTDMGLTPDLNTFGSEESIVSPVEGQSKASTETKQDNLNDSNEQKDQNTSSFTGATAAELKPVQGNNANLNAEGSIQFNNMVEVQGQKAAVNEVAKAQKEIHVPKSEIIEQVVHKAKVVLTADKSEMVMDLRPESLGKLSLKVVTERGMVVAKFVAENQQVKEALETNMQLLKDSLEKQGLSVQGFSVSVRQDSNRGMNENRYNQKGSKEEKTKTGIVGGISVSHDLDLDRIQKNNPYSWSDSQINLTA